MKTRIISGVVMAVLTAALLAAGLLWKFGIIIGFIALLTVVAVYEMLHNAAGITNKIALIGAAVFSALLSVLLNAEKLAFTSNVITPENFAALYFLFAVIVMIFYHADFDLSQVVAFAGMPIFIGFAFGRLCGIIALSKGIYYLLLMLCFSSVCDMGAYFTGSFFGKRKLCPEISPKKTVEGAVGGIVSSIIVVIILILCFKTTDKFLFTLILTVPFCMIGMLGDLFASLIKRTVGLKDYGNLIPGHGGILDRFDSMLLIAPFLYMYASIGVI